MFIGLCCSPLILVNEIISQALRKIHKDTCLIGIISLHRLSKYMTQTCERDMDYHVGGPYQEKLLAALLSLSGDRKTTKQYQRTSKVTTSQTDVVYRDDSLMKNSTKACYWTMG